MKHDNRSTSLAAAWAINSLAYSIVYPFIPIYLHEERNIPMDVVGTIFPLMGLAVILAPPVSGWLTDRIGRRFMMQFGQSSRAALFLILAALAFLQAPFWLFAVILMINAGVGTFFQVAADSYLTDLTTPEERPRVYSKIRIGTNIGWAVGPMLGAFLARTPFSLMFAITAILCMAGTFYTGHCCREVRKPSLPPRKQRTNPLSGVFCGIHIAEAPDQQFSSVPADFPALLGAVGLRDRCGRGQPRYAGAGLFRQRFYDYLLSVAGHTTAGPHPHASVPASALRRGAVCSRLLFAGFLYRRLVARNRCICADALAR